MAQDLKHFYLRVTKDEMAVLFDLYAIPEDLPVLVDELIHELQALKIDRIPTPERLKAWLQKAAAQPTLPKNVALIRGKTPGKAIHARVEWTADFFNSGFVIDDKTGAVDYRRRAAQVSVTAGQLLGRQKPMQDGEPGKNVFGIPVPGEKAKIYYPTVGQNVRFEVDGGAYYAEIDGRIRLVDDRLSVDDVYVIRGSLGLETGHVTHNGAVVVEKDVLEGAQVDVSGDLEVYGVIEDAQVKVGGNLVVHGGITRSEKSLIDVRGSVHACFILDATIEAGRDVVVEREIVNSSVKTLGKVTLPHGRVVGGEVHALRGITVGQASTLASVPTLLVTGVNYRFAGSFDSMQKEIDKTEKEVLKMRAQVEPYEEEGAYLSDKQKKMLQRARQQLNQREEKLKRLQKDMERIRTEGLQRARYLIVVEEALHRGTTLGLGSDRLQVEDDTLEPVRAEFVNGQVEVLPKYQQVEDDE